MSDLLVFNYYPHAKIISAKITFPTPTETKIEFLYDIGFLETKDFLITVINNEITKVETLN